MITTLQPSLEKHPFLAHMSPDALALMTGCVKNVRFAAGDYLFRAGTDAAVFYLLRTGKVNLLAPGPSTSLVVYTLGPGALVGWSWIVAPYRYRFDARATEPTVAFELDGKCLRGKCEANPAMGYQLLERTAIEIGKRMDDLQLRLLDVFGGGDSG